MTLTDLANFGQLVGGIAVVASLLFVGFQIRLNTRANRASTLQMNADYWLAYLTSLADAETSVVYSKGALGREDLSASEFGRFFLICRATFMGCENQHHQYRSGLLDAEAYRGYQATIREQIAAFPGIRAMWELVKHTYSEDFAAFLDAQIEAAPDRDRGSMLARWRALVAHQAPPDDEG